MIEFASDLPPLEKSPRPPYDEVKVAFEASLHAVLAVADWGDATVIRAVMTWSKDRPWLASITCDSPTRGFETEKVEPDKYHQGAARRLQNISTQAKHRGIAELVVTFVPLRSPETGHDMMRYAVEAEKWDSNPR
jgi:hypothetical protein